MLFRILRGHWKKKPLKYLHVLWAVSFFGISTTGSSMLAHLGHLGAEPGHGTVHLKCSFAVQAVTHWDIFIWFGVWAFRMECSSYQLKVISPMSWPGSIPVWYFARPVLFERSASMDSWNAIKCLAAWFHWRTTIDGCHKVCSRNTNPLHEGTLQELWELAIPFGMKTIHSQVLPPMYQDTHPMRQHKPQVAEPCRSHRKLIWIGIASLHIHLSKAWLWLAFVSQVCFFTHSWPVYASFHSPQKFVLKFCS